MSLLNINISNVTITITFILVLIVCAMCIILAFSNHRIVITQLEESVTDLYDNMNRSENTTDTSKVNTLNHFQYADKTNNKINYIKTTFDNNTVSFLLTIFNFTFISIGIYLFSQIFQIVQKNKKNFILNNRYLENASRISSVTQLLITIRLHLPILLTDDFSTFSNYSSQLYEFSQSAYSNFQIIKNSKFGISRIQWNLLEDILFQLIQEFERIKDINYQRLDSSSRQRYDSISDSLHLIQEDLTSIDYVKIYNDTLASFLGKESILYS